MGQTPPALDDATRALILTAAACNVARGGSHGPAAAVGRGGRGGGRRHAGASTSVDTVAARSVRAKVPGLLATLCDAFCARAEELKAIKAMRAVRDQGVMPSTQACVAIATACGRRHATSALSEFTSLISTMRPALGEGGYMEIARACVAAGAPAEALFGAIEHPVESHDDDASTGGGSSSSGAPRAGAPGASKRTGPGGLSRSFSSGATDAKAERTSMSAMHSSTLLRERDELRTRCTVVRIEPSGHASPWQGCVSDVCTCAARCARPHAVCAGARSTLPFSASAHASSSDCATNYRRRSPPPVFDPRARTPIPNPEPGPGTRSRNLVPEPGPRARSQKPAAEPGPKRAPRRAQPPHRW